MAFAATTQWEVRTTGNNANGGGFTSATGGTDRSQSDTPFKTYTDLVITATATDITSAAQPFTAADKGNIINITGGTGFTVQRLQIVNVSGVTASCDKSAGTTGSTGGTGNLGGAVASIGLAGSLATDENTVWIKSGTYTTTAAIALVFPSIRLEGFATTHGDLGTRPLITTATNSITLITCSAAGSGTLRLINLSLSNTAGTRGPGLAQITSAAPNSMWAIVGCLFDGFSVGVDGATTQVLGLGMERTEVKNCISHGVAWSFLSNTGLVSVDNSWLHNNGGDGLNSPAPTSCYASVFSANTGSGANTSPTAPIVNSRFVECVFSGNTAKGLWGSGSSFSTVAINCIAFGNAAASNFFFTSRTSPSTLRDGIVSHHNAYPSGGNTNWAAGVGDVTISASPFVSSSNFALNATAGGGAACKAAGFPGVVTFGTGTMDLGALQTGSSAGGGQRAYQV